MLERRRKNKHYDIVPGDDEEEDGAAERDLELGEGVGGSAEVRDQETGTVPADANGGQAGAGAEEIKGTDVTSELDNWDENAEDWDEEPTSGSVEGQKTPASSNEDGVVDTKKRTD